MTNSLMNYSIFSWILNFVTVMSTCPCKQ